MVCVNKQVTEIVNKHVAEGSREQPTKYMTVTLPRRACCSQANAPRLTHPRLHPRNGRGHLLPVALQIIKARLRMTAHGHGQSAAVKQPRVVTVWALWSHHEDNRAARQTHIHCRCDNAPPGLVRQTVTRKHLVHNRKHIANLARKTA